MARILRIWGFISIVILICLSPILAGQYFENLQPDQVIHGFKTANVYDNAKGKAFGARFISERYGYVIDLLQIQSVPQAFYWVKTPIYSSKGEPHACEHLLLGKGNRGRYVAALEDMALASSSAFTGQYYTCYHFNTIAGEDTFYKIFEAKLQALLHPDFTDEEIRREVCHIGINIDPEDSSLSLDEKGTVYTEMVSAFEKPWYHTWRELGTMVYGDDHSLTYVSGGDPDVMRGMIPKDLWDFHRRTYHLANMGVIVSIPEEISVDSFLGRMDEILNRCQDYPDSSTHQGIGGIDFPAKKPAPIGTLKIVNYPSGNPEDPGFMQYEWPADLELDFRERAALELFVTTFANSQTSNLYDLFINSETRKIDIGATSLYAGLDSDQGISVYLGMNGITNRMINQPMIDSVRNMVVAAIREIAEYPAGSAELNKFNDRARSHLLQARKQIENALNSPPMFGYRGISGQWLDMLKNLEDESGFHKSLMLSERFDYIDSLLNLDGNIWNEKIKDWHLIETKPYALGAIPNPGMLKEKNEAKQHRLAGYVEDFKKKYGVDDTQLAIREYKKEFDAKTTELEALAASDELPGFIDNPPLTLDDQLIYETMILSGGVPLVASTFENMTSSEVNLAMRLDVIPESKMVYVPLLPDLLTEIGVYENGRKVTYDEMQERLRREVLNLSAGFERNNQTGRVELLLTGAGSNPAELDNALDWMRFSLYSPYLAVENIPRIIDLIDQSIQSSRNRTKGSEEYWLSIPAAGYKYQENPLIMTTACFLTQTHHFQRLKWMFTDPGAEKERAGLSEILEILAASGIGRNRDQLQSLLSVLDADQGPADDEPASRIMEIVRQLAEPSNKIAREIYISLKATLSDIPDADLERDWAYLCRETKDDLMVEPETAIAEINQILNLIRRVDNARMYMVSNSSDRKAVMGKINTLVADLDGTARSIYQNYEPTKRVAERLKSRHPEADNPKFVGLVHTGTNNGALIFSARIAEPFYDTSTTAVLDCLSGKLMGGGGPHGLFMKTWAAGLAYSNGYTYDQGNGRVSYYAERCPDVAETMRFVAGELKNAQYDSTLTDYAIAQVFGFSRAPSRYESRGRDMAADLTDGYTPERISNFRQKVLDIRKQAELYDIIEKRMEAVYGPVIIGYGTPVSQSRDGLFFVVGPESQFESLERYIAETESPQTVYRLYPRDYWLTAE
nr:hypothetical protein [candidate division Zixibacteria bacterium]